MNRISTGRFFTFCLLWIAIILFQCTQSNDTVSRASRVDLVYPLLDTENSRWFFFSSACRPFGLVNLSPDTETNGAWGSGYRYLTDTVRGFSHIHAWQLSGLSVMPVVFSDLDPVSAIVADHASSFDHSGEQISPGFHHLVLKRYGIEVDLTSTKRVGFHRYGFPAHAEDRALVIDLGGQLGPSEIIRGGMKQLSPTSFEGSLVNAPTFRRPKEAPVFFYMELDQQVDSLQGPVENGKWVLFFPRDSGASTVKMKVGISYTSVENARLNLDTELPGWDFDGVVASSRSEWEEMLGRIEIEGGSLEQQRRFYTDLWHSLLGRRIISDVNGAYPDQTGDAFRIGQLPVDSSGNPLFNHYNSDAFWGAQWTINTLWGLVYPEIAEEFVQSLLQYYQDGGLVPRGPSGGNYTYVMTGASSTPFIVSAYQKGLRGYDVEQAYAALKKNHLEGGIMAKAGYEHNTSLGGGLTHYINQGYVPYPIPEGDFGSHQDGASLTLEYAYQDWALAQFARALGKISDYTYFLQRSQNYRNVFDPATGWMRPRDVAGNWYGPFDPFAYEHGFNESNAAQATWFVPQDLDGLAELMGGRGKAVEKLNAQFEAAEQLGFTSGTAHDKEQHPEYSRIPINYGNQPSIQTAFIFNHLGRPDLTQYWSRKVVNTVYGGLSTHRGYNGDEDQGLMGSLAVLMKVGLFQMTGGTEENPEYELGSPVFDKVTIRLNPKYYPGDQIVIDAVSDRPLAGYIRSAEWNGRPMEGNVIRHQDLVKGGVMKLEMTAEMEQ